MWLIKKFKSKEKFDKWIKGKNIEYNQIFLNNVPYAIEYRKLISILK